MGPQIAQANKTLNTAQNCAEFLGSYGWFEENILNVVEQITKDFWNEEFNFYLMCIEKEPGIFWNCNQYFVSQVDIGESASCFIRMSDTACCTFMDLCLGEKDTNKTGFKGLSELEGQILSKFNNLIFEKIKNNFISSQEIKDLEQEEQPFEEVLHIGLFIYKKDKPEYETGKMIFSIPKKLLAISSPEAVMEEKVDTSLFKTAKTQVDIFVGKSKISLDDLKKLEDEDIIILEDSNINKMKVSGDLNIEFKVNPDPKLVLSIDEDNEGDDEGGENTVSEEINTETNMWDNIQIEVGAEFKKIKLSLGELRQMSEGLVVDLASVYENQITLQVENKPVAAGELVIIGDRYGVKITEIIQKQETAISKDTDQDSETEDVEIEEDEEEIEQDIELDEEDDDFDYSDFEIDDDDI